MGLKQIAHLHKTEFSNSKPACCCLYESENAVHNNFSLGLAAAPDSKLDAFGVVVNGDGEVIGYCMLGFNDTPGDPCMRELPGCVTKRFLPPQGTCHLEQICLCKKSQGKGGEEAIGLGR